MYFSLFFQIIFMVIPQSNPKYGNDSQQCWQFWQFLYSKYGDISLTLIPNSNDSQQFWQLMSKYVSGSLQTMWKVVSSLILLLMMWSCIIRWTLMLYENKTKIADDLKKLMPPKNVWTNALPIATVRLTMKWQRFL